MSMVRHGRIEIKIEVNFVMRGTVQPVHRASLTPTARDVLMADLDIPLVSLEDMYGGKLIAALDRQHPHDLFVALTSMIQEAFRGTNHNATAPANVRAPAYQNPAAAETCVHNTPTRMLDIKSPTELTVASAP